LERVFRGAGLDVNVRHGIAWGGGTDRGLSASVGEGRMADLAIIASALMSSGLITAPLPVQRNEQESDALMIRVAPK
jgi:hypothetical protein